MTRATHPKQRSRTTNDAIRRALTAAIQPELRAGEFRLFGRGHEPRVTLDRSLAAIVRGLDLPHVVIEGFGANKYYPRRVFEKAAKLLRQQKYGDPIRFGYNSAYRAEDK